MTAEGSTLSPPRQPFSRRTAWDRTPTDFAAASLQLRDTDAAWIDLTQSNPTTCGLTFAAEQVLAPLTDPRGLTYAPASIGLLSARQAVVRYYAAAGAVLRPEQVVLTAGTSEAYSHLFRLLCDPGDEILVAQPSYPLVDYLADLSDVVLRHYPLFFDQGWWIDRAMLERSITPRTRAILLVHPNNPTGHATRQAERDYLQELCRENGLALLIDEVFLDYPHRERDHLQSFADGAAPVPTFILNGLSKIAALPQMKVGWIVARGPQHLVHEALERLEIIADSFLSVSTPAQLALPHWLEHAPAIRREILERIAHNLATLAELQLDPLQADAGWSLPLRLPRLFSDDEDAATMLRRLGLLAHPAAFYGLEDPALVVISLLTPPEELRRGMSRLAAWISSHP